MAIDFLRVSKQRGLRLGALCFGAGLLLALCLSSVASAAPQQVVVPTWGVGANPHNNYFHKLLALAFAKTEATDGPVAIKVSPESFSTMRFMAELKNNTSVDLLWYATSKEREQDLLPVRIPLMRHLNEYRVLLIRKEDQQKFSAIQSLEDLRQYTAGSGADWPSGTLLRNNGVNVVTVNNINLLFPMLKARRFDFISRNVFEVWDEVKAFERDGLALEKNLLLQGGVPIYFFVNKNNKALAERIERGLRLAMADGSFDAVLVNSPEYALSNQLLNDKHRKIINLNAD